MRLNRLQATALALSLVAAPALAVAAPTAQAPSAPAAFGVKAMVFTLFEPETQPWLDKEPLTRTFEVKGSYAPVRCTEDGLCVTTTGIGKVNAALTVGAVLSDPELDLSRAVFLSSGIAGTPPEQGTLGSAAWADWVIDYDFGHHILPQSGSDFTPEQTWISRDKVELNAAFRLNPALVNLAYETTKSVPLADGDQAKAYRALYPGQADRKPDLLKCTITTSDDYFHGGETSQLAAAIVKERTGGQGTYCGTAMEDNAIAGALFRAGYLDRYVALRTMSNFDQPHPGQTVAESLNAKSGGFPLSIANEYAVGSAFAHYAVAHRDELLALADGNVTESDVQVTAAGAPLTGKVLVEDDRSLVRAEDLAAALGATAKWNADAQAVVLTRGDKTLTLPILEKAALVNGTSVALEAGARTYSGFHYVPLRFVAEQFGFTIGWDGTQNAVSIH